jgi:hypothetical protein
MTQLKLYWLTDGDQLYSSKLMKADEVRLKQQVQMALDHRFWWIQRDNQPDLPKSDDFVEWKVEGANG